ncbi:hypothetical protein ACT2FY_01570 [Paraburkholderia fungorum]|uniref:hypothetical protein n=1 Tax=Paraburkholderia fungorum TaxID=134537 RepID=UPI00402B9815
MGRTPKAIVAPAEDDFDLEKLEVADQAARQLAAYQGEQDALVRATAAKIGYLLPADATDPDLIQRDISANMRRSVEACLRSRARFGGTQSCLWARQFHGAS